MKGHKVLGVVVFIIFLLLAVTYIFPLLFMLFNSFKSNGQMLQNIWSLPTSDVGFSNYEYVFERYNIGRMFLNSIILTVGGVVLLVAAVSVTAYVTARFEFVGRRLVYGFAILVMLIPGIGTMSATYNLLNDLGLLNKHFGVILQYANPFGMNFLILYGFFKSISGTYSEAAKIDGANEMRIFFTIMLPFAAGGIAIIALMSSISFWNDFNTPYIYMRQVQTIATGLQDLTNTAENRGTYTQMFAAMIIAVIPVLVVYICLQKPIMSNLTVGGIKG